MEPIKVLWFTNTPSLASADLGVYTVGGGWIGSLEERMGNAGQIRLAIAFNYGKQNLRKFEKNGTTYYSMPDKRSRARTFLDRHRNMLNDDEQVGSCLEVISDFKPDIIHIFGTEKGFGLINGRTSVPVVIHLQGILTIYEKKWFSAMIAKWRILTHSGLKNLVKATSLLHNYAYYRKASGREQAIFKTGCYFMGRTDWDKRLTSVLAPDARYFTCNEILRKEFYLAAWKKQTRTQKTFISTIQANIFKGLETVLECAVLLKQVNAFDFTWIIAGTSEDERIVRLFEKKAGRKFKDLNILLAGSLGPGELLKRELEADIFIHPSHIDNSPNSVCEAMLLGMPVIATYTGGTGSLLTDKTEGLLIQDGDPYSMAGAVLELIDNPNLGTELGQNARKRAMERHDPDAIVQNLIDIYAKIIAAPVAVPA